MFKSAAHHIQRSWELGLSGTLKRTWRRISIVFVTWSQSLWWGWKARRELDDTSLLAQTTGEWRSMDILLDHLANRPASSFMLPHESSHETAELLQHEYPEYASALLAAADAACRNELTLLGKGFQFPPSIDWHRDPVTGWRFSVLHRSRVGQYLGSARPVDLILFWELNRHQHFISLGIGYWLTGEQRYIDAFCSQIQGWIDTNPLQHGVNWYYGLEVSIRLLAWTTAFQFFRKSPEFRQRIGKAFLKSLWQQADFLSNHLQSRRISVPNNHLMAELTGLVLIGVAFPEFRAARLWRETGLQMLNQQAATQTHPDGVNKEQAIGYHRFVAELLLLVVARSHQDALPYEPVLEQTLERMLDYILFTLTPVGTTPMWGDSDYGRALGLGQNKDFWDFRSVLSAGAVLFGRPEWKFAAGRFDEEAFWILGLSGLNLWKQLDIRQPEQTSRAFPQAGLYIIRDKWTADTDVAFFRCGPFGLGGEGHCAHAHCDLLSFVLWVNGQPVLVDSGTYIYHGPWRDAFRLTAAHNTVTIDGYEQAKPMPNFNWQQIPEAMCIAWTEEKVTGALTYPSQVEFIRELAHPRAGVWGLIDKLQGKGAHTMEWFFHFAPSLSLHWNDAFGCLIVEEQGSPFVAISPPTDVRIQIESDWYSSRYREKEPNHLLRAFWQGEIPSSGRSMCWVFRRIEQN